MRGRAAMRSWASVLAFTIVVAPSMTLASRVGLVVRLPDLSPAAQSEVVDALAAAGDRAGDQIVRAPFARARDALSAGAVRSSRLRPFGRAAELLAEGTRAYQSADSTFAAARFAEARREALAVADLPGGVELVAEVSLRLGAVRVDLGQPAGLDDLRLAHLLNPDRDVTTAEFKPSIVSAFDGATSQASAAPLILAITSEDGARVALDGRDLGAAPVRADVAPGLHLLTVTAPSRVSHSEIVMVRESQPLTVALEIDAGRAAIARGRQALAIPTTEAEAEIAAGALLTFAELDAVVIASAVWRRGRATLLAERCSGEPLRCGPTVEVGYGGKASLAAAARELWARAAASSGSLRPGLLTDARVTAAEGPGLVRDPTGDETPWYRSPYVWVGLGAGTALAVTATILLIGGERRPEIIVDDDFVPLMAW